MRRIEQLLIAQGGGGQQGRQIEAQPNMIDEDEEDVKLTGLLFLSLFRLQAYVS